MRVPTFFGSFRGSGNRIGAWGGRRRLQSLTRGFGSRPDRAPRSDNKTNDVRTSVRIQNEILRLCKWEIARRRLMRPRWPDLPNPDCCSGWSDLQCNYHVYVANFWPTLRLLGEDESSNWPRFLVQILVPNSAPNSPCLSASPGGGAADDHLEWQKLVLPFVRWIFPNFSNLHRKTLSAFGDAIRTVHLRGPRGLHWVVNKA